MAVELVKLVSHLGGVGVITYSAGSGWELTQYGFTQVSIRARLNVHFGRRMPLNLPYNVYPGRLWDELSEKTSVQHASDEQGRAFLDAFVAECYLRAREWSSMDAYCEQHERTHNDGLWMPTHQKARTLIERIKEESFSLGIEGNVYEEVPFYNLLSYGHSNGISFLNAKEITRVVPGNALVIPDAVIVNEDHVYVVEIKSTLVSKRAASATRDARHQLQLAEAFIKRNFNLPTTRLYFSISADNEAVYQTSANPKGSAQPWIHTGIWLDH